MCIFDYRRYRGVQKAYYETSYKIYDIWRFKIFWKRLIGFWIEVKKAWWLKKISWRIMAYQDSKEEAKSQEALVYGGES